MPLQILGNAISEAGSGAAGLESADFFGCGGFFETLRVHRRRIALFDWHWARLASSLERWGWRLPASKELILEGLRREILAWPPDAGLRIRMVVAPVAAGDSGVETTAFMGAQPLPESLLRPGPDRPPVNLRVFRDFHAHSQFPLAGMKSVQRQLYWEARRRVRLTGADDAILLNERGEMVETTTSNLFWMVRGELYWPDAATGALPGVFGEWLARKAESVGLRVHRARRGPEALLEAEAVLTTNSVAEAARVASIDGRLMEVEQNSAALDHLLRLIEESRREIENTEVMA